MAERYGDFELLRLIATGGMAEIYLAKHGGFGGFSRTVVVKRMLPQLAVRPDFVQMFLDEARLAANLNHPNIVQVFNLGEFDQSYYIAMEFVDGPHLGSLFAHSLRLRKPLPIDQCAYVVARAADGLHYAHERHDPGTGQALSIVHRDISPQNVLVSRQGDVKVTDFGVAKASTQQTKTRTGIIKGKVAYMSPEQCLGELVDRRTDVFALGIVLYELLTRRRLFRDKSDLLIMQKITAEDVPPPSSVNRELDREIDAICSKALSRSREARYQNASDLAEALDAWLARRAAGDPRLQLQRWFEAHALELAIGSADDSQSNGSIPAQTAHMRTAQPPQEITAATPSLNSAETVMRAHGQNDTLSSAPGGSRVEKTQRSFSTGGDRAALVAESRTELAVDISGTNSSGSGNGLSNLPDRGKIEDEPTMRAQLRPVTDVEPDIVNAFPAAPRPGVDDVITGPSAAAQRPHGNGTNGALPTGVSARVRPDGAGATVAGPITDVVDIVGVDGAPTQSTPLPGGPGGLGRGDLSITLSRRPQQLPKAAVVVAALAVMLGMIAAIVVAVSGEDDKLPVATGSGSGAVDGTSGSGSGSGGGGSGSGGGGGTEPVSATGASAAGGGGAGGDVNRAPPVAGKVRIVVESVPSGVSVVVDDQNVVKTPASFEHAPGKVKLAAQFKDQPVLDQEIDVAAGDVRVVRLLAKVPLIVKSTPPKGKVRVDGELLGETPLTKPGLVVPEKNVRVKVELAGWEFPPEKIYQAEAGQPLVVEVAGRPLRVVTSKAPPPEQRPGFLNMRSSPWVNVKIGSKKIGATTFLNEKVPSGRQTLVLTNPDVGISDTLIVTIPEDKTLNVTIEWEKKGNEWRIKTRSIKGP